MKGSSQKAAASGSSFYYSFLFLPPERRRAITALYAFCREVDDVVDEMRDPGVAATKLAWWRTEIAQSFAGTPHHPVMQALVPLAAEHLRHEVELDSDPQVMRYSGSGRVCSPDEVATFHRRRLADADRVPGLGFWVGFLTDSGGAEFVGAEFVARPLPTPETSTAAARARSRPQT